MNKLIQTPQTRRLLDVSPKILGAASRSIQKEGTLSQTDLVTSIISMLFVLHMIVSRTRSEKRFVCDIAMTNKAENILVEPCCCVMSDPTFRKECMLIPNVCELRFEMICYIIS